MGGFRYGEDYPKPIIQPVSLVNTEEAEEEARREQAKRDEQILASKRRKVHGGRAFNKPQWENSRQQRPAETPTAAVHSSSSSQWEPGSLKGKGKRNSDGGGGWKGGYRNDEGKGGNARGTNDWHENKDRKAEGGGNGRRWGNRVVGG